MGTPLRHLAAQKRQEDTVLVTVTVGGTTYTATYSKEEVKQRAVQQNAAVHRINSKRMREKIGYPT